MSLKPFEQPIYVTRPILPDRHEFAERLKPIWESKWLSNGGAQSDALETQLCEFLRVPHLSLFNNGTIALLVAVQSLRLQGEVITTPFTFPATTHVLAWNGITPVFCDVDPRSLTLAPGRIEELITSRTTGILAVHVYGMPCDVKAIQEIADRHGLRVIYDAAHAFGTEIDGVGIGNFGDVSMFSFHPTKLFHTVEGGALTFANPYLKPRVDLLKNFGIKNETEVIMPGINGKMNEIQALMGQLVLDQVAAERGRRKAIRDMYRRGLGEVEGIGFVNVPGGVLDSQQYMVVRIEQQSFGASRDAVYDFLRLHNVYSRKYFYPLISEYPCYRQLPTTDRRLLPAAYAAASEVLCLPFYGELVESDIGRICDMVRATPRQSAKSGKTS